MLLHKECLAAELNNLTVGAAATVGTSLVGKDGQTHVLPQASDTVSGLVELATVAETVGLTATLAVTPLGLRTALFNETDFSTTVTAIGTTTAGAGTYSSRVATATRIGNTVWVNIRIQWTAHTGTGNIRITGLPYLSHATAGRTVFPIAASNTTYTAGSYLVGNLDNNANVLNIQRVTSNVVLTAVAMDTTSEIYLNFSYKAA